MNGKLWAMMSTGLLLAAAGIVWAANEGMVWEKRITTKDLGGEERYLLYASTDKPIYREGESVYLRGIALNAADNTPHRDGNIQVTVKIRGPKGDTVFQGGGNGKDSSAGVKWEIPQGTAGGQYTALVSSPNCGAPETKRTFEIRAYRAPRLKTQIEFMREGYGPGDTVRATVKVDRAEGGIPAGAAVTVVARVDGKEVFRKSGFTVGRDGTCATKFSLPDEIRIGDGSLSFVIEDGGVVETASKTIPILLQTMDITFYPEGGDLIAGLRGRVYVQANRPDGKPADIAGQIVALQDDKPGKKGVADLRTTHEGRGVVTFTPKADTRYALIINSPSGISRHFALPTIKKTGAVLKSLQAVYPHEGTISVAVASTPDSQAATVTISKREVELDSKPIAAGKEASVALDPKDSEGVLIVTIWDAEGHPLAERLIYRKPKFAVNVAITPGEAPLVPGGKVKLDILTTDENGKPVEAVVGLTVTDDAVLEMMEKREHAPRLPVMVYLENEVRDLADAHVYLDAANSEGPEALDLLLGTQGWRRFILMRYAGIKKDFPEDGKRALAERVLPRLVPMPMAMGFGGGVRRRLGIQLKAAAVDGLAVLAAPEGGVDVEDDGVGDDRADHKEEAQAKPPRVLRPLPSGTEPKKKRKAFQLAKKPAMAQDIAAGEAMADFEVLAPARPRIAWMTIREYAHQVRPNRKANDRVDFTETLYWNTGIRTSARDGKATVEFGLSDSVTTFRVMADAFGRNGALGTGDLAIKSIEPFYIEPKMPLEVTAGDAILLPIALVNATKETLRSVNLLVRGEGLTISQVTPISLAGLERGRQLVTITADKPGTYPVTITAAAGAYTDTVTRSLTVKAAGFPVTINHGGLIGPEKSFTTRLTIPEETEAGSLAAVARVYPTPLANMEEALNALLRQPNGCFEQTSSTNYPLVMAGQYFTSHQGISPEKIAKAKTLLEAGLKKLTGFECKKKGYEWFGGDPGHEALTAYGLMEFSDMAKIMPVDADMIGRTRDWLLSRRDGKGGFKRNKRALDSFGRAPVPTTNAYILWAMLESGEDAAKLKKEIAAVKKNGLKSKDSYVIALAANIMYLAGDNPAATTLATRLSEAVEQDGHVGGAGTSITRSGGDSLAIETTSLTILAWLKDDARWAAQVEGSMKWLFERCKAGRFGSTQSTILALKAINAYDAARATPKQPGTVQLIVNGTPFGKPVAFDKDSKGAIELPDFAAALTSGNHSLELKMADGSRMPFSLEVAFNTSLPATSEACELALKSVLSAAKISEGEPLEMTVTVTAGDKIAPTPIAIVGIPGGCEVRHDQLKELVGADRISSYEVLGREVVLYWRALKAREERVIPVSLTATIPGTYTGPASRTYLYYTDEHKRWEAGHAVTITARSQQR
ncbi:MAG: A-macroglobulin complement component [Lentisphaerae bacterium]|nr:A-macroglobulin complement component [Lentisphaerota bacterium]MBT4820977.1 A-macroglobulin complement component [Lentisphaerota bacterium]MBT5606854.1 A-macroglobulin complement component [Lentisphaerota bacterium]MBT7055288.1 A-macroglobulin complement component [Lentisphaerota bacterium]MBT7843069.1 A-macroglobulin complement component [Lentisphaerota bacterium]